MYQKKFFIFELILSLTIVGLSIYLIGISFFSSGKEMFLNTTDAVPIYTKVKYAAECLRNLQWPSWFPNWYCGTSISQYYPPLTYIIMTPLELIFQNTTIVLKIYYFFGLLIGGMGVWWIFYRYIGRICGILAAVLYVTLPYFVISFFIWGNVAQIPIIAMAPWYVICCIEFYENQKMVTWLKIIGLTFLLLLSHVMHGFMIAICMFVTLFILSVAHKRNAVCIIMWVIGTGLAAGILGFWWVTGVLPLENPGVPTLGDWGKDVTANLLWFFPEFNKQIKNTFPLISNVYGAFYPIGLIFVSGLSYIFIRKEQGIKKLVLLFLFIQTLFAFVFSFGSNLPLYKFIPMASQLVPGRILTQASIGATILAVYFTYKLLLLLVRRINKLDFKPLFIIKKTVSVILLIVIVATTYKSYQNISYDFTTKYPFEESLFAQLDSKTNNFNKGRIAMFGDNLGSTITYFSYINNYNIVSGWNLEGTSTANFLKYQNTALVYNKNEFILKNMNDMNVQTCFINTINFSSLSKSLQENNYAKIASLNNIDILKKENSNYFMEQPRNSIVIGKSSYLFLSDNPWFVNGYSSNPTDYDIDYYKYYDVIYFCEPQIDDISQLRSFEDQLIKLVGMGKKVFLEFGRTVFPAPILGVSPVSFALKGDFTVESNDQLNNKKFYTGLDAGYVTQLIGTEEPIYKLKRSEGDFSIEYVGSKKVGNGEVIFIGGPISQLKSFAFNYLTGKSVVKPDMIERDDILTQITSRILVGTNIYKNLDLPVFDAQNVKWLSNSCKFSYNSDTDKRVMSSITYTPRWKVFIDGVETKVYRVDNMVVFDAPSGSHDVFMKYTMTIYGKVGIGITIFSLIIVAILVLFYKKITYFISFCINSAVKFLEFKNLRKLKKDQK